MRRVAWTLKHGALGVVSWFRPRSRAVRRGQDLAPVLRSVPRRRRWTNAVRSLRPASPRPGDQVWAVTMVRNEADIVEYTVRHLLAEGVDRVVVADNLSDDETPRILRELSRDPRVVVVPDRLDAYYQGDKMTRLARAATAAGAAWVIPFDADEAWLSTTDDSLADVLRGCDAGVVKGYLLQYVPLPVSADPDPYRRFAYREPEPGPHKVAFRANYLSRIGTGNHAVSHPGPVTRGLKIAHVPYRSLAQMRAKVRTGASALAAATGLGPGFGAHWSELGALDDEALSTQFDARLAIEGLVNEPIRVRHGGGHRTIAPTPRP